MRAPLLLSLWIAAAAAALAETESPISIAFDRQAGKTGRVEVQGLTADQLQQLQSAAQAKGGWSALFAFGVGDARATAPQPMLGEYSIADGKLRFEPRFALRPGLAYTAIFRLPDGAGTGKPKSPSIVREFRVPADPVAAPTVITQVYPTRNVLPENQLKFYLHFSAPMSQGDSYRHLHLLDAKGAAIDLPFLELGEELWDKTGTRLTVLFDPGRIKRGLKPREDVGPVLEEGKRYTLVIDAAWPDAAGQKLKAAFQKPFNVGPPDSRQPDVKRWVLHPPPAASRDALVVDLDEPLDHAMLQRVLSIRLKAGEPVRGRIEIDREETRWQFRPEQPWRAGTYALIAETTLEDLAGNSLGRPFEVDVFQSIDKQPTRDHVSVAFEVRAKP